MELSCSGRIGLGVAVVIRTVWSPTASTAVIGETALLKSEVLDVPRCMLKTTSAPVNGVPSWKRTPWRRSNCQVVGSTSRQATASAGSISELELKSTSGS
jgi:hypothetical protein